MEAAPAPAKKGFPLQINVLLLCAFFRKTGSLLHNNTIVMFLVDDLFVPQTTAKILFHLFRAVAGFTSVCTAILADSVLGAFKQYYVYVFSYLGAGYFVFLSSFKGWWFHSMWGFIFGQSLISVIYAFLTPVLVVLPADHFKLPEDNLALTKFFIFLYWVSNIGAIVGTFFSPILRRDIPVCGGTNCFPLCFGISYCFYATECIVMIIFINKFVRKKLIYNNVVFKCISAAFYAISMKIKTKEKKEHWLDHAEPKFSKEFLADMKQLKVIYMMLPVSVFYSMYAQQETTWVFQARRMNGDINIYIIPPDQMYFFNPLLCVTIIPIFNYVMYPAFAKRKWLVTTLQRVCAGAYFYAISFALAAIILYLLERQEPKPVAPKTCSMIFYNPNNCTLDFQSTILNDSVPAMDFKRFTVDLEDSKDVNFKCTCGKTSGNSVVPLKEKQLLGLFWTNKKILEYFNDRDSKEYTGNGIVRVISNSDHNVDVYYRMHKEETIIKTKNFAKRQVIFPGDYYFYVDETNQPKYVFRQGGVYVILVNELSKDSIELKQVIITKSNTIHMLWMLPQYFLGVVAELLVVISFHEFYYRESPQSLKACIQAIGILVMSLGDCIVILCEAILPFKRLSLNVIIYIIITLLTIALETILSIKYKYISHDETAETENK